MLTIKNTFLCTVFLIEVYVLSTINPCSTDTKILLAIFVSPARFSGGDIQGSLLSSCVGVGVTKKFCHIFLRNHTSQIRDIWHRASVWRTVSCNTVLNLRHVHFLFYATMNIVDIGKFAHKIISVTFFSGTTQASFLIFGTEHQYGELYRVTQF